jgi:hypothetical protein
LGAGKVGQGGAYKRPAVYSCSRNEITREQQRRRIRGDEGGGDGEAWV